MKNLRTVALLLALVAAWSSPAQAQPVVPADFEMQVTLRADRNTALQLFDQNEVVLASHGLETVRIWDWPGGARRRVDFLNDDGSSRSVYRFWPGAQPICQDPEISLPAPTDVGIQYDYDSATDTCTQSPIPLPHVADGYFDFLQNTLQHGTCTFGGRSGSLWILPPGPATGAIPANVAVCSNGNSPRGQYWTLLGISMDVNSFTPGVPAPSNFHVPVACAATPDTHDSVVLPMNPVRMRRSVRIALPAKGGTVTRTLKVRVANGDVRPDPESPGHTIQLTVGSNCPDGTVAGIADFGKAAAGPSDTVVVAGGDKKAAKVTLSIDSAAWTTLNAKAPRRCTLVFTARTVNPTTWFEPTPANNIAFVELNVIDSSDVPQATEHESLVSSLKPVTVKLAAGAGSATAKLKPIVVNADILPAPERPGDAITVSARDGTCSPGTVGAVAFARDATDTVTVAGGKARKGSIVLSIDATAFAAAGPLSPARCVAEVTATGPTFYDPDRSNNTTRVQIDVLDANDF